MKSGPWPISRYELISRTCALLVAGIGLGALIGWFAGSVVLRGIRPGYIPMAPNTALIFFLLGILFATHDSSSRRSLVLVRIAAFVTIVLVLVRLGEYFTGADFRVDRWFFQFEAERLGLAPVGKMAFFTAANFLLLGLALFFVTFSKHSWTNNIAQVLSIVAAFMGLAFSLGYLYGAPLMYGGASIPMALNTAIAFLILGSGILVRASVTDIAERRQVREAVQQAHHELEERVNERTAELRRALASLEAEMVERKQAEETLQKTEDQLRQSQKLEAVGRLAGGVAHDFNNLLTVITGYSELLLIKRGLDDAAREKIEEIRNAGVRAASLTRQLLAFSRKQVLQPVVLDLNSLIEGTGKMLGRLIGEDIQITTVLRPEIKRIHADPGQIEQVIVNLAVNARDAMPQGGKITIETANVELDKQYAATHIAVRAGHYVMISLSDTGTGMDEKMQKQIFEPFFTTKEMGKGTGLGLSTVYGIVKQSGGNIWVYSEVGKGTTFKIYFPQVEGDAESRLQAAQASPLPQGTETILLAEDERMVRALTRENLRVCGYQVLEAANGEDALRVSREYKGEIHLLLTDVVMPRMSGRELAERVAEGRPGLPVLYVSGFTDDAIVQHGVLEPGTEFLEKPFTLNALARKVRQVLDKHQP
jgi:signal transduction histidine kinase